MISLPLVTFDLATLRQCLALERSDRPLTGERALPPSAHQWLREQIARLERFVEEHAS